jgi:hypothetical protein
MTPRRANVAGGTIIHREGGVQKTLRVVITCAARWDGRARVKPRIILGIGGVIRKDGNC